jgi:hypothetical protein
VGLVGRLVQKMLLNLIEISVVLPLLFSVKKKGGTTACEVDNTVVVELGTKARGRGGVEGGPICCTGAP